MKANWYVLVVGLAVLSSCATPPANNITVASNVVVLPDTDITTTTANSMKVETDKSLAAGQVVVSDKGDGVLRSVTAAKVVGQRQVSSQIVRKVYELTTTDASLEDAITQADVTLDPAELKFDDTTTVQSLPGVHVEAVSGKITLKNVSLAVAPGVTVNLNGSLQQSIDPKFTLKFAGGKVSLFEAGVSGNIGASLQAKITTTGKATLATGVEQQLAKFAPIRSTFAIGAVPVVVVMEPRLVAGAAAGADKAITINTGIAPTLDFNTGVRYSSTSGWGNLYTGKPIFTAKLNPTFDFSTPSGAEGTVYAKLVVDVKFYGLVGPSLEVKPQAKVKIAAPTLTQADLSGGLSTGSKVVAGFKILGKGMENEYPIGSSEVSEAYTCTSTACTAK